jgi:hypothetical protein
MALSGQRIFPHILLLVPLTQGPLMQDGEELISMALSNIFAGFSPFKRNRLNGLGYLTTVVFFAAHSQYQRTFGGPGILMWQMAILCDYSKYALLFLLKWSGPAIG